MSNGLHPGQVPTGNPASNTAARVSLPLTMSNIQRTGPFGLYPPRPYWSRRPLRLREARGISPRIFSRQLPEKLFFSRLSGWESYFKRTNSSSGPCGARCKTIRSAGGGHIRLAAGRRKWYSVKDDLIGRYPQVLFEPGAPPILALKTILRQSPGSQSSKDPAGKGAVRPADDVRKRRRKSRDTAGGRLARRVTTDRR